MIRQGFWPSLNGDRKYGVTDWESFHSLFIGNGVFSRVPTSLQVIAKDHMTVNIEIGAGFINGKHIIVTENPEELDITTASGVYDRITRIILRANSLTRSMEFIAVDGEGIMPGNTPTAPPLVRNEAYYDLALADIRVNKNTIELTNSMITDLRPNSDLCGWVSGLFAQFEADDLFSQFSSIFNTWFSHLENELTSNQAANLQLQIDTLTRLLNVKGADIGDIKSTAAQSAPNGWLICDGQTISKSDYSQLFSVIGYQYGGSENNFALPDLRGKTVIGTSSNHPIGESLGSEIKSITLSALNMPEHNHTITTQLFTANYGTSGNQYAKGASSQDGSTYSGMTTTMGKAGSTQPFEVPVMQPSIVLNYIIYTGVFN